MSFIGGHALGEGSRTGRSQESEGSPHREVRVGVDPELVQHLSHKEAFFFFLTLLVIGCGLPILGRAMGHFLGEFGKGQFSGEVCICELLAATMDSA